jgi:hypothetical protein
MYGSVGGHVHVCVSFKFARLTVSAHFRSSRLVDPPLFDLVKLAALHAARSGVRNPKRCVIPARKVSCQVNFDRSLAYSTVAAAPHRIAPNRRIY